LRSLILDVETTISNKGNPFDERNKLCYVGLYSDSQHYLYDIDYSGSPNRQRLDDIQRLIDSHDIIVGFNIKFDLHWIRRYGINIVGKRVWDCQLVHYILTQQQNPYPSLNGVAEYYGLGNKLDVVASEYWGNNIDTTEIPRDVLEEYLIGDLHLTQKVYEKQLKEFASLAKSTQRLISLHNQDLLVLQEMEYNGIIYNEEGCNEGAKDLSTSIARIDNELYSYHMLSEFNPSSTEHVSSLLYGGTIKYRRKEVVGVFKTGARKGQEKEQWKDYEQTFERLVTPIKGSELEKEGFYSVDDQTLKSLKFRTNKARELVELILARATLMKRLTAYYQGLPDLRTKMNWPVGKLHGVLNQCVAKTGRLSSTKPNLQNFDGEIKQLFGSRYAITS